MSEGLTWDLGLDADLKGGNEFLRVLTSIDTSLKKMDGSLGKTERDAEKLGHKAKHEFEGIGHAVDETKNSIKEMLEFTGGMILFEALEKGIDFAKELGAEILHAATANERLEKSFKLLMGEDVAEKNVKWVEKFSDKTEFTEDMLKGWVGQLTAAGVKEKDLDKYVAAIGDVAARNPDKIGAAQSALAAFTRAQLTGSLSARQLVGLNVPIESFKTLPGFEGLSDKALKKKLEEGKIKLTDVLRVVAGPDKILGDAMVAMGDTMGAKLTHLKERPEQFFEKFADTPAFERAKVKLDDALKALDPESPTGKRIFSNLETAATRLMSAFEGIDFEKDIKLGEQLLERLPGLIDAVTASLRLMAAAGQMAIGPLVTVGGIAAVTNKKDRAELRGMTTEAFTGQTRQQLDEGGFTNRLKAMGHAASTPFRMLSHLPGLESIFHGAGEDAGAGVERGLKASVGPVSDAGAALGKAAEDGFRTQTETHSPSRLFLDLAREGIGGGLVQGIEESADAVDSAVRGLFTMKVPKTNMGAAAAGGGGPSISISTQVDVHVGKDADAQAIGDAVGGKVSEINEAQLVSVFERLAISAGTAAP